MERDPHLEGDPTPERRTGSAFQGDEIDREWLALFAALPEPAPAPGLADRVFARLQVEAVRAAEGLAPWKLGRAARWGLALSVGLGALTVAAAARLAPWLWALGRELNPVGLLVAGLAS